MKHFPTGETEVDDEEVFEWVQARLLHHPHSVGDLSIELDIDFPLVMEALDVLKEAEAITTFREARGGQRTTIFGILSQTRTWVICKICRGTGEQMDQRRCLHCNGQGIYTPNAGFEYYKLLTESSPNARS